ncbi:MAG: hypothetical protein M3O71_06855 [Bacteroidota bacterium]|nr:hypothetical protein [Bacteroidota bacterium]
MKKLNDGEIQSLLEGGLNLPGEPTSAEEKKELEQYRFLFEKLKEEPKEGLPFNFAAKVKNRLQAQLNRKRDIRFYLITFVALILGFAAFYQVLVVVNENAGVQFMAVLYKFKWVIFLGAAIFMSILYLDQKLVKESA